MPSTFVLPEIVDVATVAGIHRDLAARAGADLDIDASNVRRIGGLGLQLLLAAEAAWEADGHVLRTSARSPAFDEAFRLAGFSPSGAPQ